MAKWTAIVLTCASKNSSIAYQRGFYLTREVFLFNLLFQNIIAKLSIFQELKLRQDKGIIDSESLIICIEDPEKPIGSGGATLNALLILAENLSARKKYRVGFNFKIFKI